jgi:diguanylate cyclase (GGDEF)-like protein/PAS domain S-box-containing protein
MVTNNRTSSISFSPYRRALIQTLAYLVFAGGWIFGSDYLLGQLPDLPSVLWFGALKGLIFVGVTAVLLYLVLTRSVSMVDPDPADILSSRSQGLERSASVVRLWWAMGIALLVITGVATILLRNEIVQARNEQLEELASRAVVKSQFLSDWLHDRQALARNLAETEELRRTVLRGLTSQDLDALAKQNNWESIEFWNPAGQRVLSTSAELPVESEHVTSWASAVRAVIAKDALPAAPISSATKSPQSIDVALAAATSGPSHLAWVVPIHAARGFDGHELGHDLGHLLGVMVFHTPDDWGLLSSDSILHPWGNDHGETWVMRSNKEQAEVLNTPHLGHKAQSTLAMTLDDGRDWVLALNQGGLTRFQAMDDRGIAVLAGTAPVPGVPWSLIVKVDESHVMAPTYRFVLNMIVMMMLCVGLLVMLGLLLQGRGSMQLIQAKAQIAARFRRYAEQAPLGIVVLDAHGGMVEANKVMAHMLGKSSASAMVGQSLVGFFPDEQARAMVEQSWRTMAERDSRKFDIALLGADGKRRWVNVTATRVEADRTVVFVDDISVRRAEELHMRQAEAVFKHTQEGLAVTTPDGHILMVNAAFCAMTGYPENELVGQRMQILRSGYQDDAFYAAFWRALQESGQWQGELWNRRKNGEVYPERLSVNAVRGSDGEIVNYVAACVDVTRAKRSEQDLKYLAHHDLLTGLPNRVMLMSHLSRSMANARRNALRGAVLLLDLDRFKNVNDSLGHAAGDQLLRAMAERLRQRLRESDMVARLGGDEFVVVLDNVGDPQEAGVVAHQIIEVLSRSFTLRSGHEVFVGASVGISLFPDDADDAPQLLQQADAALYQAKGSGRGTYCFHTQALTDTAQRRLEMETRLRHAMDNDELQLHYQPLVDAKTRKIVGVEALARWHHPVHGMVSPAEFIPVAEETRLILRLGEWVLYQACWQMAAWMRDGVAPEVMAVNLSTLQFAQSDLPEKIARILKRTGVPGDRLELELTESALMDAVQAVERLSALKALGVRLAVDDFGTGYSSLSYLSKFPIDKLKVDQSFVRGIPSDPIASEIASVVVALGHSLGMEVLAEGVETQAQFEYLITKGCNTLQGWLFARAMDPADVTPLLRLGKIDPTQTTI